MSNSIVPANEPIVESVLEWTIARDAEDIGILMHWISKANKKRERETLIEHGVRILPLDSQKDSKTWNIH